MSEPRLIVKIVDGEKTLLHIDGELGLVNEFALQMIDAYSPTIGKPEKSDSNAEDTDNG